MALFVPGAGSGSAPARFLTTSTKGADVIRPSHLSRAQIEEEEIHPLIQEQSSIEAIESPRPDDVFAAQRARRLFLIPVLIAMVALLALLTLVLSWSSPASAIGATIQLDYASYKGKVVSDGVACWLGMRYAAPPIGHLRFAAPQDPATMPGVQDANTVSQSCLWEARTRLTALLARQMVSRDRRQPAQYGHFRRLSLR
jgi:hypothetical protein